MEEIIGSKTEANFQDIPFRVIIFKILPFVEISKIGLKNEFTLFGYFKNDRQRKIFLLFSSLTIKQKFSCWIDIRKIRSLRIKIFKERSFNNTLKKFIQNSEKLERLRRISLEGEGNYEIIFSEKGLPNLKSLEMSFTPIYSNYRYNFRPDAWISENAMAIWRRLESLSLSFMGQHFRGNRFPNINKDGGLMNLRTLYLESYEFPIGFTLELPKVENIRIWRCSNLTLTECTNVRTLESYQNPVRFLNVFLKSHEITKLRDCTICGIKGEDGIDFLPLLEDERFHDLKKISFLGVNFPSLMDDVEFQNQSIESLKLQDCEVTDELFEIHDYKRLKCLSIIECDGFSHKNNWSLDGGELVEVNLSFLDYFNVDAFFSQTEYPRLKKIDVRGPFRCCKGRNWKKMKNLEVMKFDYCMDLEDVLFQSQNFPKLRILHIDFCYKLKGVNWSPLSNVEYAFIKKCPSFRKEFFITDEDDCPFNKDVELVQKH